MKRHAWVFLALWGGMMLAGFLLAQSAEKKVRPLEKEGAFASTYRGWLDEDVRYIITPEERSRFRELKSDAERDQFIREFWLKRDPTPETEQNEYKEEHYRRIAYSNEHFASDQRIDVPTQPGWKSDRGRAYIIYGPPDEIQAETSDAGLPVEVWRYRKSTTKSMVLRFVDTCACGNFELKR